MHYVVINIAKEFPCFPEGNSILLLLTSSYRIIYNKNVIVKVIKMLSAPKISGILCTSQSVMIWRLSSSEDNEKEKKKDKN